MPIWNRMSHCIFGWYFYIEIWLKYEKLILLSSSRVFSLSASMENSAVCQLKSFFIVYPHFFVFYPFGQQWGYMEKSYKMQQTKFPIFQYSLKIYMVVITKLDLKKKIVMTSRLTCVNQRKYNQKTIFRWTFLKTSTSFWLRAERNFTIKGMHAIIF